MTPIDFLISLLLTLYTAASPCDIGENVDWYDWLDAHPRSERIATIAYEGWRELWIYDPQDGSERIMFVLDWDNWPHGQCAVVLDDIIEA